jgi:hypothetical protein
MDAFDEEAAIRAEIALADEEQTTLDLEMADLMAQKEESDALNKAHRIWELREDLAAKRANIGHTKSAVHGVRRALMDSLAESKNWRSGYPGPSTSAARPALSLSASPRRLEIEAPKVITPVSNSRTSGDLAGTRSPLRPAAHGMTTPGFIIDPNVNDDVFSINGQPEEDRSLVHHDDNDDDYVAPAGDDYDFQDDPTVDPSGSDSGLVLEDAPSTVSSGLPSAPPSGLSSGLPSGSLPAPPPVFGANAPLRQFDTKYLAASVVDKASLVRVMSANMERRADGKFKRDYTRTDAIMDYDLEERMALYSYGWNPDALDNGVFAPHSDEGHLILALIAAKDKFGGKIQAALDACVTPCGPGPDYNCCPRVPAGLPPNLVVAHQCPDDDCQGMKVQLSIPPYRIAAMCKLPDEELWKMLLPKTPTTKSVTVRACEASALCNEFSGDNHCIRHVVMETKAQNGLRSSQHGALRSFQASPAFPTLIGVKRITSG